MPIVGPISASPLKNKSSSNPRAILMSPSAALHADRQERQSGTQVVVTDTVSRARCTPPYAPTVVERPKYLSHLPTAGRSIVAIATEKSDRADNGGLTAGHAWARGAWPVYASGM